MVDRPAQTQSSERGDCCEVSPQFGNEHTVVTLPKHSGAGMYGQSQTSFTDKDPPRSFKHDDARTVTMQQLLEHSSKQSAWISLKGIVYDVTEYMKHHPGGDILLSGCGRQSQQLFNQHHPWVNAKNILNKWRIGKLQQ